MERELEGRTALVTGAGTGIGRGIALELARAGAAVVVIGRRAETLEETAAAIGSAGGRLGPARNQGHSIGAIRIRGVRV